jgi:hypothetical protein
MDGYILHYMLQRMRLGFLEIVTSVDWIEPGIQKVLGPLPIAHNNTRGRQSFLILRRDKVNPVALQVAESLDNTVWWHYRLVDDHELFEPGRGK